jgi:hypothetical protein
MTLEQRRGSNGAYLASLRECPACGHEFTETSHPHHHIAMHDPEDFELTPLEGDDE